MALIDDILNKNVRIKSLYSNTHLNVWGSNDAVANYSNVTVYTLDSSANSQKWLISTKLNKVVISTKADERFEIDYYRGSSNFGNATMYNHGSDMTDAQVEITGTITSCKIKNVATGHYLTTETTSSSSNVKWLPVESTNRQLWSIEIIASGGSSKELNMPACHNQKYHKNKDTYTGDPTYPYSVYFNHYCCGACSVAHIAEFYSQTAFNNDNLEATLKSKGVISDTYYGATWSKCPSGVIGSEKSVSSYSSLYATIKSEIDQSRPVIVKQTGGPYGQHYVVAYKYTNGAQSDSDIYVLDSANLTQGTIEERNNPEYGIAGQPKTIKATTYANGRHITLKESLNYNECTAYSTYMLTSPN